MKNSFYIKLLVVFILFSCNKSKNQEIKSESIILNNKQTKNSKSSENQNFKTANTKTHGYLYISIEDIYYRDQKLVILDSSRKDTIIFFKNKKVAIGKNEYNIIDEEYLYKNKLNVNTYNPEYGLFILKSVDLNNDFYQVQLNDQKAYINKEKHNILTFKSQENHVLESYPILSKENPLRLEPNDDSEIIDGYMEHLFIPLQIEGDWLKLKDDKDCYIGKKPSENDIIGWVRWRKEGKIIIEIRHSC